MATATLRPNRVSATRIAVLSYEVAVVLAGLCLLLSSLFGLELGSWSARSITQGLRLDTSACLSGWFGASCNGGVARRAPAP